MYKNYPRYGMEIKPTFSRTRYKDEHPLKTVTKIKEILDSIGIQTAVQWYDNGYNDFSCRVKIANNELKCFDIGTNGKGMSKEYALASAYAEFMERLQNKAMFREGLKYSTFYYINVVSKAFVENLLSNKVLLDFLYYPDEHLENGIIYAPFLNLSTHKEEQIPLSYYRNICGSTGMSAGNTIEEAMCQSLNEIVERFILCKIFTENIHPKTLSIEDFIGNNVYNRIKDLQKNFKVVIHDWSQNKGYPVIGMLLQREKDGAYTYRLGADFNIITALERCFTEIFQGRDVMKRLLKAPSSDYVCTREDYYKCRQNGTGIYPHYLLSDFEANATFPHHDFSSYKEELHFFVNWLRQIGYTIYFRDNSFLGFPAVTVYIPEMSDSEMTNQTKSKAISTMRQNWGHIEARYNLKTVVERQSKEPFSDNPIYANVVRLNPWNANKDVVIYPLFAETMIQLSLNNLDVAFKKINSLIERLKEEYSYSVIPKAFFVLQEVLGALLYNKDSKINYETMKPIKTKYGDEIVSQVVSLITRAADHIQDQNYPTCFNCSVCPVAMDCRFLDVVAFEKKMQVRQKAYYDIAHTNIE